MPRQKRLRKVVSPPNFKGFRPYGNSVKKKGKIELLYEEYEAIKLADYDLMKHQEASELMGISRATFARIYENARRKIAQALVETKEIVTVYGNAFFDKNWFICKNCDTKFTIPPLQKDMFCPMCKSKNIEIINT